MDYLRSGNTRLRFWGVGGLFAGHQSVELSGTAAAVAAQTALRLLVAPVDVKTDGSARAGLLRRCYRCPADAAVGALRWDPVRRGDGSV